MRTYLDCIPCFFKQALEAAKLAGAGKKTQRMVLNKLARLLPKFSLASSPPEIGQIIYGLVKKETRERDPYKKIREENNKLVLRFYSRLKKKVSDSKDRLLTALELAIAGNIIDFGVKNTLNVEKELKRILEKESRAVRKERKTLFNHSEFKDALKRAKTILYLADNAGETVFDRILIEEIKNLDENKKITYAVKHKPIINDALLEDARICGIDKEAELISCGSDAPGAVLPLCSRRFLRIYKNADMVISKGQGNFEALSEEKRPIFFLFMAKCPVVAENVNCKLGDVILFYNKKRQ